MRNRRPFHRVFPVVFAAAILLTASVGTFAEEGEKYRDPDTPKIRASFTVVPDTDDVKELRAFIVNSFENWSPQMRGRYRDDEDYGEFLKERSLAQAEAAGKMIAICESRNETEIPEPEDKNQYSYSGGDFDNDYVFALKWKTIGLYRLNRQDEWLTKFEEFIETLEGDPAKKNIAHYARSYWFCGRFYNAFHQEDFDQGVSRFQATHRQAEEYFKTHSDDPDLQYHISIMSHVQQQCAERLETSPKSTIKKGTLMIPTLEFYRSLYAASDKEDAPGWVDYCDRELAKYEILAADDPMAAFCKAVDEKKAELEKQLDKDARKKLFPLQRIAKEMENRNDADKYFYKTMRPVFAASDEEFAQIAVMMYDMELHQLEMIGLEFELEAVLLDGTKIDIKDFRGKVVLIDYWATWCGPCAGEMLTLKAFYKNWPKEEIELIGVSVDEDLDALRAFVEKEELPWPNASQVMSLEQGLPDSCEKYAVKAYPTTILIDRNGKVARVGSGFQSVITEVGNLLASERED